MGPDRAEKGFPRPVRAQPTSPTQHGCGACGAEHGFARPEAARRRAFLAHRTDRTNRACWAASSKSERRCSAIFGPKDSGWLLNIVVSSTRIRGKTPLIRGSRPR